MTGRQTLALTTLTPLIPAKAGIQSDHASVRSLGKDWVPASAGTSGGEDRVRLPLRHHGDGAVGVGDDLFRYAAEQQPRQAAEATAADDDEVGALFLGDLQGRVGGIA